MNYFVQENLIKRNHGKEVQKKTNRLNRIAGCVMTMLVVATTYSFAQSKGILPVGYNDLVSLYGQPGTIHNSGSALRSVFGEFSYDGMTINFTGQSIEYRRETPFYPMEIPDILKPLSNDEAWVQKGDHNWELPKAKCIAHWDGEGLLTVKPE